MLGESYDYWMAIFDNQSYYCRKRRYQNAKSILLRNISDLDAYVILSVIKQNNLEDDYINHGVEGVLIPERPDPIEALFNFVDGTALSAYAPATTDVFGGALGKYESTGIRARDITMLPESNMNKNQMCDKIIYVLRTGNSD